MKTTKLGKIRTSFNLTPEDLELLKLSAIASNQNMSEHLHDLIQIRCRWIIKAKKKAEGQTQPNKDNNIITQNQTSEKWFEEYWKEQKKREEK